MLIAPGEGAATGEVASCAEPVNDLDKVRAYNREYNRTWRQKHGYRVEANSKARYPLKEWCRAATRSALTRRIIQRENCGTCGATNSQAHHDDYTPPLTVKWTARFIMREIISTEIGEPVSSV